MGVVENEDGTSPKDPSVVGRMPVSGGNTGFPERLWVPGGGVARRPLGVYVSPEGGGPERAARPADEGANAR